MGKRYVIQGEIDEIVLIGVELSSRDTSLNLYIYKPKKGTTDQLTLWRKNEGDLPEGAETIKRTIADQHLLPEDIRVKDVGKVRLIENAWAEALIQNRLFLGFDSELNILQESVAALEDYSENLFQECSGFWKRVIAFKREYKGVDDNKIDSYKIQLDILFEVLKSLRKDHKKEFDHKSIENKAKMSKMLDEVSEMYKNKTHFKFIYNKLKEIRKVYLNTAMRHGHKDEIDKRINEYFEKTYKLKQFAQTITNGKRQKDLEAIIKKMNLALDWKLKILAKEENNLKFVDHIFQEKLIQSKIDLINKDVAEIEEKLASVKDTYNKLNKETKTEK